MSSGIPQLLNQVTGVANTVALLTADVLVLIGASKYVWGIYISGTQTPVVIPDTILSVDFNNEWAIPDYPVEQGSFAQYNKISTPYNAKVRMAKGSPTSGLGGVNARSTFLSALEAAAASTNLYDVRTPEKIYRNANILSYSYSRTTSNGAAMIVADIALMEVRTTAVVQFQNVAAPSAANSQTVQTFPVTNPDITITALPT